MFDDAEAFTDFANSHSSGYLKSHKGYNMFATLTQDLPVIRTDPQRLRSYLTNCLEMEGFRADVIEDIAQAIETHDA
jgi:hypothetical protein